MLQLSQNPAADQLLSEDPLALLIGMVLDQQVPLERAFSAPLDLKNRLGGRLDADEHRRHGPRRAGRRLLRRGRPCTASRRPTPSGCRSCAASWSTSTTGRPPTSGSRPPTGEDLLRRVRALPGFGEQKARIFVGLLGKQLGVRPPGWEEAAGRFGEPGTYLSVADIVDAESLGRVRAYKAQMKAAAEGRGLTRWW